LRSILLKITLKPKKRHLTYCKHDDPTSGWRRATARGPGHPCGLCMQKAAKPRHAYGSMKGRLLFVKAIMSGT